MLRGTVSTCRGADTRSAAVPGARRSPREATEKLGAGGATVTSPAGSTIAAVSTTLAGDSCRDLTAITQRC